MNNNFQNVMMQTVRLAQSVGALIVLASLLLLRSPATAELIWATPLDLSTSGRNSEQFRLAASADGSRVVAVWRRYNGSHWVVQASTALITGNTASWSAPYDLSVAGQNAADPNIAISADGTTATAVWTRSDGTNDIVQTSTAVITGNSASWAAGSDLSLSGQNGSFGQIALSTDGTKGTAIWIRNNGVNQIIQTKSATISGNSATWSVVQDLSADGQGSNLPRLALSADGTMATAVWRRHNGSVDIIQAVSATITGNTAAWGAVSDLTAAGRNADYPEIDSSADGTRVTAVWRRYNGSNDIVQARSATISGNTATWGVVSDLSAAGEYAERPKIAVSADGTKATCVWRRHNGTNEMAQASSATISGNSAAWGSVSDISTAGQDTYDPQLGLSSDGTQAAAVWRRYDGSYWIIQAASGAINGNTAVWNTPADLSTTGQNADNPLITLSADGTKAIAIWNRSNGSNWIVQAVSAAEPEPEPTPTPTPTPTPPETPTPTPTPIPLPDLLPTAITATSNWKVGAAKKVTVTIQNQGSLDVESKILTKLYLSASKTLKVKKAVLLGRFSLPSLLANTNYQWTKKIKLPAGIAARKYYLFASTDPANEIAESDENNNLMRADRKIAIIQ